MTWILENTRLDMCQAKSQLIQEASPFCGWTDPRKIRAFLQWIILEINLRNTRTTLLVPHGAKERLQKALPSPPSQLNTGRTNGTIRFAYFRISSKTTLMRPKMDEVWNFLTRWHDRVSVWWYARVTCCRKTKLQDSRYATTVLAITRTTLPPWGRAVKRVLSLPASMVRGKRWWRQPHFAVISNFRMNQLFKMALHRKGGKPKQ